MNAVDGRTAPSAVAGWRDGYRYWTQITTRFSDNDMYGHVNNVQYYSFFDTLLTNWLVSEGGVDLHHATVIGLCVESQCHYHSPLAFPEVVLAGLRVGRIGRSSVRYEIALSGEQRSEPAADGYFVHVFVHRDGRRKAEIPDQLRGRLERLLTPTQ